MIDLISANPNGGLQAHGSVAQKLIASGMKVNALRSNATLRKEEWLLLDTAVIDVARQRLSVVGDMLTRGMRFDIPNGLGTTVLQWEEQSDMEAAQINMDGVTRGRKDRLEFDINSMPLPITHHDFQISIRTLEASRKLGEPLDTNSARVATRKVVEQIENTVINGASGLTFGGGTLRGFLDFGPRNTVSLVTAWDDSGGTGSLIKTDVISMVRAATADRMFGPYGIYVPTEYFTQMGEDYTSNYPKTIMSRLLEIPNIEFVRAADFLPANEVLMFQLDSSVADVVVGLQPTVVSWESEGGMVFNFKVMAIMVLRPKQDFDGRCGIVHLS